MNTLGNVQQKIHCVFQSVVVEEATAKRSHQTYKVVASENIRDDAQVVLQIGNYSAFQNTCVVYLNQTLPNMSLLIILHIINIIHTELLVAKIKSCIPCAL